MSAPATENPVQLSRRMCGSFAYVRDRIKARW